MLYLAPGDPCPVFNTKAVTLTPESPGKDDQESHAPQKPSP